MHGCPGAKEQGARRLVETCILLLGCRCIGGLRLFPLCCALLPTLRLLFPLGLSLFLLALLEARHQYVGLVLRHHLIICRGSKVTILNNICDMNFAHGTEGAKSVKRVANNLIFHNQLEAIPQAMLCFGIGTETSEIFQK